MERSVTSRLESWAHDSPALPLLVRGARQVGKTYVLKDFASRHFSACAYVNLMAPEARAVFGAGGDARQLVSDLAILTHVRIEPGSTLLLVDEVQEVPDALARIRDLACAVPGVRVACASSFCGPSFSQVGLLEDQGVEQLRMGPLSFAEFLRALGEEGLAEALERLDFVELAPAARRLDRLMRQYCLVGGMPEAVSRFADGREDYDAARQVQRGLLVEYGRDLSRRLRLERDAERARLAFDSVPRHLGARSHKFVFGHVAPGARSRDFEPAVGWLAASGLVVRVPRADVGPAGELVPDDASFRAYLNDVGLLACALDVEPRDVVLGTLGLAARGNALAEQYVCQQLVAAGLEPCHWVSSAGTAEVAFVVGAGGRVVPVDVAVEESRRAKSLRILCEQTGLRGVRASLSGARDEGWMENVPLWAVGALLGRISRSAV